MRRCAMDQSRCWRNPFPLHAVLYPIKTIRVTYSNAACVISPLQSVLPRGFRFVRVFHYRDPIYSTWESTAASVSHRNSWLDDCAGLRKFGAKPWRSRDAGSARSGAHVNAPLSTFRNFRHSFRGSTIGSSRQLLASRERASRVKGRATGRWSRRLFG